ncbi:MAG TPA: hypothetical protein VI864_06770 [Candidatus Bathyarchaeia archaeon]|nr:hypothetical protein [Candidatus Bathyarchaeia archaeon]
MNRNFKNVAIHKSAHEQARFLANIQNRSMASVIEELVERVFQLAMSYEKEGLNIDYETCVTDSTLLITVSGRNKLKSGNFTIPSSTSEKEVDRQIKKRLKS